MKHKLLLILSTLASAVFAGNIDFEAYCKLKCPPGKQHTVCKYRCEISPDCKEYVFKEITDEIRIYIRDGHNKYRNQVASGEDTRGGNAAAQDMLVMNYHREMEVSTLCLSRRCVFAHDECRHTLSFDSAGQNLCLGTTGNAAGIDLKREYDRAMISWFNEIKATSKEVIERFPDVMTEVAKIGHFTQMMWSSSKYIGCSMATWRDSVGEKVYTVCHYSPIGNTLYEPVYKFGKGCTGDLKPNDKFPALCGTLDTELVGVAPVVDGAPGAPSHTIATIQITISAIIIFIFPSVWVM